MVRKAYSSHQRKKLRSHIHIQPHVESKDCKLSRVKFFALSLPQGTYFLQQDCADQQRRPNVQICDPMGDNFIPVYSAIHFIQLYIRLSVQLLRTNDSQSNDLPKLFLSSNENWPPKGTMPTDSPLLNTIFLQKVILHNQIIIHKHKSEHRYIYNDTACMFSISQLCL